MNLILAFLLLPTISVGRMDSLAGERVARDWKRFPAIVEMDDVADIYAIGDIHGEYDRLITLLADAKIIGPNPARPDAVRWLAGKAVLICTGDVLNKGRRALEVIALFRALEADARSAGGRVIVLMGNHEAQYIDGPDEAQPPREFSQELKDKGIDPRLVKLARDSGGIGAYLRGLPLAARLNDWFFAHAGDTEGMSLKELRQAIEAGVAANGFAAEVLLGDKGLLEARLRPRPWWEKENDKSGQGFARLRGYVQALGVKHLVVGHQPGDVTFADGTRHRKGTIYEGRDGLIFLIDVGMSSAVDYSRGALLHIQGAKNLHVEVIHPGGKQEPLGPTP
jgi:Calcineurin-like phosphoesterase